MIINDKAWEVGAVGHIVTMSRKDAPAVAETVYNMRLVSKVKTGWMKATKPGEVNDPYGFSVTVWHGGTKDKWEFQNENTMTAFLVVLEVAIRS